MRGFIKAGLMAAAAVAGLSSAAAQAAETFTMLFTSPNGGVSAGLYSGTVKVTVAGTGNSNGIFLNDAFYYNDGTRDPVFYQLNFGTSPLIGYDGSNYGQMDAQNADNFIVGGLPAFNSDHFYTFLLNTGAVAPTNLYFGVSDGQYADNGGEFRITIEDAVPEPATWAMMILGMGMIGAAVRRKSLGALPA